MNSRGRRQMISGDEQFELERYVRLPGDTCWLAPMASVIVALLCLLVWYPVSASEDEALDSFDEDFLLWMLDASEEETRQVWDMLVDDDMHASVAREVDPAAEQAVQEGGD